jgi:hypothetical protein
VFTSEPAGLFASSLSLPDATLVFDPSTSTTTTVFANGTWTTTAPASYADGAHPLFLGAVVLPVSSNGIPAGTSPILHLMYNVTVSGSILAVSWACAAAVYSKVPPGATQNPGLMQPAPDGSPPTPPPRAL